MPTKNKGRSIVCLLDTLSNKKKIKDQRKQYYKKTIKRSMIAHTKKNES